MAMNPKLVKVAKWVGYPSFFLVSFLLCAYWTFPYERVKDFLIQQVEYPKSGRGREASGFQLEIGSLEPSWITGVELTGVRLVKMPETAEERATDVAIPRAHARIGLLALLGGTVSATFDADVAGGTIEGAYEESTERLHVDAALEAVRLNRISILRSYFSLPIKGQLGGTVDLTIAEEQADTEGSLDLRMTDATVGDGQAKLKFGDMRDGVTVEEVAVGTLAIAGEVGDEGVMELSRLQGRGDDVQIDGAGSIRFNRRITSSRIDVLLRLAFSEAYREGNPRTGAMFGILDLDPRLRAAKTPDGSAIQLRITGAGSRINARPAGREPAPPGTQ